MLLVQSYAGVPCNTFLLKGECMKTVQRIKKAFTNIPATLQDVVGFITTIAEKQRAINTLKKEAKTKVDAINSQLTKDVAPLKLDRDTFFTALFAFAQPRKLALTATARCVVLASGTFGWRWTPPAVLIRNGLSETDVVNYLEKHDLLDYVRVVKEVNREALLRDRPVLPVIAYTQREEFFAKPALKRGEGSAEELITEAIDVAKE